VSAKFVSRQPIRVLAIDHGAGVPAFRKKHAAIAAHGDIDLTVLAPSRWIENYREAIATPGVQDGYRLLTGGVVWPGYENRGFFRSGLTRAFRASRPDILHLWEEPFSLIALQSLLAARLLAPRAAALFWSADNLSADFHYSYRPSWLYAAIERHAHRRCALGTSVSREVEGVLRAKGFTKRVEVIPNALDLADYGAAGAETGGAQGRADAAGTRADAAGVRARLGLEPPVVACAGRLLHQKGIDLLLRAAATLRDAAPGGRAPSILVLGDGPERAALHELARALGIAETTRFLAGIPHGGVPGLLSAVEVLVLPSRGIRTWKEQFGRVLIEGMAAGACVVGSSSGAIPEVIGDAGLVFPEEDHAGLAAALSRLLRDDRLRERLRAAGRERVRERYTWEAVAAKVVGIYRELTEAAR
jgi:glycosyltransferase involved in cell wall biosynthesis